jgi:hypothetical protein
MSNKAKWASSCILAVILIGATFAMAQVQDKGINVSPALKYKVVKMPANILEAVYNTDGKPRRPPIHPVFPLDDLSAEGWELVSVTACETGEFVCFLRKRR